MVPRDNNPTTLPPCQWADCYQCSRFYLWIESATAAIEWFFHLAAVVARASFAGISVNQLVPEWTTLITSHFCMAVFAPSREYVVLWILATTLKTASACKIFDFLSHVWRFGSFNAVVFPKILDSSLGASKDHGSHGCLYSPLPRWNSHPPL